MPKTAKTHHSSTKPSLLEEPTRITKRKERIRAAARAKNDSISMIQTAEVKSYLETKEADKLDDDYRMVLAASVTPERSVQQLATVSAVHLGLPPKLIYKTMPILSAWTPFDKNGNRLTRWPGSFEEGLVAIHYTASKKTAEAIAADIGPMAPHRQKMKTLSGRKSRRPDPSTNYINLDFVDGSGCVGLEGRDFTEMVFLC